MKKLIDKTERFLLRTVVLGMVLLVVVQGIMVNEPARLYLSWAERMEGEIIEFPAITNQEAAENEPIVLPSPQAVLTFSLQQYSALPQAKIMINNQEGESFVGREVEIPVMGGDIIEIDCRAYNFPVEFVIESVSENMAWPERGKTYTANQSIVMIGKIIVK